MRIVAFLIAAALAGCATVPRPASLPPVADSDLRPTIATLASDAFAGRMAGTPGEARTIAYLADRFRAAGLDGPMGGPNPYWQAFAIPPSKPSGRPPSKSAPAGQAEFAAARVRLGAVTSHNVVGVTRGRRPDGHAVLVMAHWDHLGLCRPPGEADRICNGAVDNASGVAAIVAVAERVARMKLDRDVWFVATGAEEWGLLGAKAFAARPPLALQSIVASFNLDTIAIAPAGAPVAVVAPPGSPLLPVVREAARRMHRAWDNDGEAREFLQRQDGWALGERGVPMVMAGGSFSDFKLLQKFLKNIYHGPDDELTATLDLGGAADDANLHVELVRMTASRRFHPARGASR